MYALDIAWRSVRRKVLEEYILKYAHFFPRERLPQLISAARGKKCADKPENAVRLYNPAVALVMSVFLGIAAADRFYIGDYWIAAAKLLVGWWTLGIWQLVDILIVYKKAKEKNFLRFKNIVLGAN